MQAVIWFCCLLDTKSALKKHAFVSLLSKVLLKYSREAAAGLSKGRKN